MTLTSYHREQDPGDDDHWVVYVPHSEMAAVDALPDLLYAAQKALPWLKFSLGHASYTANDLEAAIKKATQHE